MQLDANVLLRHKAVKVITAHGGAFVPYQAYRLAAVGPKGLPGAPERRQQLQSLYFDTTMAGEADLPPCWHVPTHKLDERWLELLAEGVHDLQLMYAHACDEVCSEVLHFLLEWC